MKNNHFKRLLFLLFISMLTTAAWCQEMSVESFRLLDNDLTANMSGTMKYDQNGDVAALIKIVTTATDFNFDVGTMGIVATSQQKGEIWVYVPGGVQRITISHSQLGVLRDYYFPMPIEKARTYELKLTAGAVRTIVDNSVSSQYVVFKVKPSNAILYIDDDEPRTLDADGMISVRLKRGQHNYRIIATSHISEAGIFEVKNEKIIKEIELVSSRALLSVTTASDAEIWINDIIRGTGSWTGELDAGVYIVESRKPSHHSMNQEVTLSQQEKRSIVLAAPMPMYGTLDIQSAPLECDVFVDDELQGQTPLVIEKVLIGNHIVRVQKRGYKTATREVYIQEGVQAAHVLSLEKDDKNLNALASNSFAYIDLGLSVCWAVNNIGANVPEEAGNFFSWAETNEKPEYTWFSYKWGDNPKSLTKYCSDMVFGLNRFVDNKVEVEPVDDVAYIQLGSQWHVPSKAEWEELKKYCTWTWTKLNGVNGYKITSNKVGYTKNSIFIPAVGRYSDKKINNSGSGGYYWSNTLQTKSPDSACIMGFSQGGMGTNFIERYYGCPIRPVFKK